MSSSNSYSEIITPEIPLKYRLIFRFATLLYTAVLQSNLTVNRPVLNYFDPKIPPNPNPIDGVSSSDLTVDASRDLFLRIFTPTAAAADSPPPPVIFYFHGGGFVSSYADSTSSDATARRYSKQLHAVVISVNYRLAPEHRFPCQYEDGFDALRFIDDGALTTRGDLGRCFILGESAGGNLGHHVAVRAGEYEFKRVKLIGFIASQPFFGGEERTESEIRLGDESPLSLKMTDWFWRAFLPAGEGRDHAAANVNGTVVGKFPATVIFGGGMDLLIDRQRRYYEGLMSMGKKVEMVVFSNAVHGSFGFPDLPEYSMMIQKTMDFIANLT